MTLFVPNGPPGHATSPSCAMQDANAAGAVPEHTSSRHSAGGSHARAALVVSFEPSFVTLELQLPR
jgi:hypothetical protein